MRQRFDLASRFAPLLERLRRRRRAASTGDAAVERVRTVMDGVGAAFVVHALLPDVRLSLEEDEVRAGGLKLDARAGVSQALGVALGGERAWALCEREDEVEAALDVLRVAAHRGVPLVVHVVAGESHAHAPARGTTHDSLAALCETGAGVLVATNVQEVVDLTLAARRIAERVLRPMVVVMDRDATAWALQEVDLPDSEAVAAFLGAAADRIPAPTPEQRMTFGEHRRRVPRVFDAERPVELGSHQDGTTWMQATAADAAFQVPAVVREVGEGLGALRAVAGRVVEPVTCEGADHADVVLLALGSTAEVAHHALQVLQREHGRRIGVVTLRCLRPTADAALWHAVSGARHVVVLERAAAQLASEPPLLREVRAMLAREHERRQRAGDRHARSVTLPALHAAMHGLGGAPLRCADLIACARRALEDALPEMVFLGIDFTMPSPFPKRQALVDRLRRQHPEIADLGLRAAHEDERGTVASASGTSTAGWGSMAMLRSPHARPGDMLRELARLVGAEFASSSLRWRGRAPQPCTQAPDLVVERLAALDPEMPDPGDDGLWDVVILRTSRALRDRRWLRATAPGAAVFLGPEVAAQVLDGDGAGAVIPTDDRIWYALADAAEVARDRDAACAGAVLAVLRERGVELPPDDRLVKRFAEVQPRTSADRRVTAFTRGLREVRRLAPAPPAEDAVTGEQRDPFSGGGERDVPERVRALRRSDGRYDSLPRFEQEHGVILRRGAPASLTPDPYLAASGVPPWTSLFADRGAETSWLPRIDGARCTGCGACWSACPDGAFDVAAWTPAELLEAARSRARAAGATVDALAQVAGKVTARMAREIGGDAPPETAGDLLRCAGENVLGRAKLPADRARAVHDAVHAVADAMDPLPIVRCAPFFDKPESAAKGSGRVLGLLVDPAACKACGVCVQGCPEEAIHRVVREPGVVEAARRALRVRAALPDPSPELVEQARAQEDTEALAAVTMHPAAARVMVPGDDAEPGSGARLAVRRFLAVAAATRAPRLQAQQRAVESLQQRLAEAIRDQLAQALPVGDLDALAEGLEGFGSETDVSQLTARLEAATRTGHVDAARLRLRVDAARPLADLRWKLASGPNGWGRAPFGVVWVDGPATRWGATFPDNPFQVPVVVDAEGEAAVLARGLLESLRVQYARETWACKHAEHALERPNEALVEAMEAPAAPQLSRAWSEEERREVAPLLVVADERAWQRRGARGLRQLLGEGLPVKVVLLTDLALDTPDLGLAMLVDRQAYVAQTSLAHPDHFVDTVEAALEFAGPAVVRIHAPSPQQHGFAPEQLLERAAAAVRARALPLYRYDPRRPGVFGARLDVDGNPDVHATWTRDEQDAAFTFVHWAAGEERFGAWLRPLQEDDPAPLELADWVELAAAERAGKTPCITLPDAAGKPVRWAVAQPLAAAACARAATFRTLVEWAGVETPFTERVRDEAQRDAERRIAAEKDALERQHAARLAAVRAEVEQEMVQRLERRLAELAEHAELLGADAGGGELP